MHPGAPGAANSATSNAVLMFVRVYPDGESSGSV